MNNYKLFKKLALLLMAIVLFNCSKFEATDEIQKLDLVKVEGDYLYFKDSTSFFNTLNQVNEMDRKQFEAWESGMGFLSMRTVFEKAVDEDTKYFEALEEFEDDNEHLDSLLNAGLKPNSDYVIANSEFFMFHPDGWFEMNIRDHRLSRLVNKEGLIRIGNDLLKHSYNKIIAIHDGDISKLINSRDMVGDMPQDNNISVYPIISLNNHMLDNPRLIIDQKDTELGKCDKRSDYRVLLYHNVSVTVVRLTVNPDTYRYDLTHYGRLYSFRKTIFGWSRRFETGYLRGHFCWSADWGFECQDVETPGQNHTIERVFNERQYYHRNDLPYIYQSKAQGWGRGCYCAYPDENNPEYWKVH